MDKPFYLDFLETLSARYQIPDPSRTKLWAMQTGFKGQKDFEAVVQEVLPHGWRILHDLNFDHSIGKIQIDALLVSPYGIYHFETPSKIFGYFYFTILTEVSTALILYSSPIFFD